MTSRSGEAGSGTGAEADPHTDAALEQVLREVPRGALALAGITVGLLILAWFLVYLFVFLPRGTVG